MAEVKNEGIWAPDWNEKLSISLAVGDIQTLGFATSHSTSVAVFGQMATYEYITSASAGTIFALTSALAPYVTSSSLTTLIAPYVTSASLATALGPYITSASHATSLAPYLTSASAALGTYVTSGSLATALVSYLTSASNATLLGTYLTSASANTLLATYATSASLVTALAPIKHAALGSASATGLVQLKISGTWTNYHALDVMFYGKGGPTVTTAILLLYTDGGTTPFLTFVSPATATATASDRVACWEVLGVNAKSGLKVAELTKHRVAGVTTQPALGVTATATTGVVNCIGICLGAAGVTATMSSAYAYVYGVA